MDESDLIIYEFVIPMEYFKQIFLNSEKVHLINTVVNNKPIF